MPEVQSVSSQPLQVIFNGFAAAATACQVSEKTIYRKRDLLVENGAEKDESGAWQIPYVALVAAGFQPGKPAAPDGHVSGQTSRKDQPVDDRLSGQMTVPIRDYLDLEKRVSSLTAEVVGKDREIEAISRHLRMLEAGPTASVAAATPSAAVPQTWREWRRARKAARAT